MIYECKIPSCSVVSSFFIRAFLSHIFFVFSPSSLTVLIAAAAAASAFAAARAASCAAGAGGGHSGATPTSGGGGGFVEGAIATTPGQTLYIKTHKASNS